MQTLNEHESDVPFARANGRFPTPYEQVVAENKRLRNTMEGKENNPIKLEDDEVELVTSAEFAAAKKKLKIDVKSTTSRVLFEDTPKSQTKFTMYDKKKVKVDPG